MERNTYIPAERQKRMVEFIESNTSAQIHDLSTVFGVSEATVRRDLDDLDRQGAIRRTHGGAIKLDRSTSYEQMYNEKLSFCTEEKRRIAEAAANMVHDGDTLFINSGTTTYFTAVELKKHKNLNVVTNSISVAVELGDVPTFRIILLGGEINAQYSFTYGEDAKEQLSRFKAGWAILSIDGVCPGTGLTTYHAEECAIDRIMQERAERTLIVADSTKLGYESFSRISGLDGVACWITDAQADRALTAQIAAEGVDVRFA